MLKINRIGRRIVFAFLIFGVTLVFVFGVILVIALQSFEANMLDDILYTELQEYQMQIKNAKTLGFPNSRMTIHTYITPFDEIDDMPVHVRDLTQGFHNVTYNDRYFRVLVEHIGETRFTVQFDETSIRQHGRDFVYMVWLCSIIILIIALVIGWKVSLRVINPIKQLVKQVSAFKHQPGESLDLSVFSDDEIGILAEKFQHHHEQLQQLLIREKEFASNVSHELRTPVTSISLAAELMSAKPNLSALEFGRIRRIQRAVDEISELIETFLMLAQIKNESNLFHDDCALMPIIRKVIEQQRVWLGDKPVEMIIEEKEPLKVKAPPGILSVLVANLVRNAFRYTNQGTVTVSTTTSQLIVTDTGAGINAAMQAQLSEHTVNDNSGNTDRARLGLSIVQRICERYGWTLSFNSAEGQGSQFTVLFF
ncbi:sensor histidine kinase [Nitrosomonas supralitoralis]|uniref:histidine kinase n=1 Tax=Nitrosomonas supralitoralis TaxID=2116706 RepID=A0A2P7NTD6_9PROT|nr:HAMP domain-containing sensor histidine kinase [Nitrosomonas supralitoralis]PSJ16705.1 hypothetical protein C7H79_12125 [Nitrosomonas supralitoralis]